MAQLEERSEYLDQLVETYHRAVAGEGHTVFLVGEAGIGKTSVVNHFLRQLPQSATIFVGGCDPLSTPRPLGPLYDIASQISPAFSALMKEEKKRHVVFSVLMDELSSRGDVVIVFEDVHWADEATIDLIKFLARRIYRTRCLFLLTYRDEEIHARHGLKSIFGELVPRTFSKINIKRLSLSAVRSLAARHGSKDVQQLYDLTSGNPFYVTEILASKDAIPDHVKDSVLAVVNSKDEKVRSFLEFLSILPSRIEDDVAEQLDLEFPGCIDQCLSAGILISQHKHLSFKHELFRITIEESLSNSKRKQLHRKMLALIDQHKFQSVSLSQIVHHAQYADERKLVSELAPRAGEEASLVGAHLEASKLYEIAIRFADDVVTKKVLLYEKHAYECYLTNQISQAITSQQKALDLWRELKSNLKEGDALRFLSRLWWYSGNHANAVKFAEEAIRILENGFPTRERTLAYSNMAQLYMLADERENSLIWANKAIELSTRMNDFEILSHALNNAGSAMMRFSDTIEEGQNYIHESLSIALQNDFHEHAARAYTNLSFGLTVARRYAEAEIVFNDGLKYCEERDLSSWRYYMQSEQIKMLLGTERWDEAEALSNSLVDYENHPAMTRLAALTVLAQLSMRRGDFEVARKHLSEAHTLASTTGEPQRIVMVLAAKLELCWLANEPIPQSEVDHALSIIPGDKPRNFHFMMLNEWVQKFADSPNTRRSIRDSTRSNPFQLTNRQIDVLNLLSEGLQNKEIADRLFISAKTVDHHISAVLEKLDVNSRAKAVTKAQQLGLLKQVK